MKTRLFFILPLLVLSAGCYMLDSQDPRNYSESLIVPEGAYNIRYLKWHGNDQAQYLYDESFPAFELIKTIKLRAAELHWKPLKTNLLNPRVGTMGLDSWNAIPGQRSIINQWTQQWENHKGDILLCSLQYGREMMDFDDASKSAAVTDGLLTVNVNLYFWPKKRVERNIRLVKAGL